MRFFWTVIIFFSIVELQAQLFSRKDIALSQGLMSFHNNILNNSLNSNTRISLVTELDKNFYITRFTSINAGIGLGNYKNLGSNIRNYESSDFFRTKIALIFHSPQFHKSYSYLPKLINPYLKAGYNIDIMSRDYRIINNDKALASMRLGAGIVFRVTHQLGIIYEISHNQQLNAEFRTFLQHNIGIIINLQEPAKLF